MLVAKVQRNLRVRFKIRFLVSLYVISDIKLGNPSIFLQLLDQIIPFFLKAAI